MVIVTRDARFRRCAAHRPGSELQLTIDGRAVLHRDVVAAEGGPEPSSATAEGELGRPPTIADLTADAIAAFARHLESSDGRGGGPASPATRRIYVNMVRALARDVGLAGGPRRVSPQSSHFDPLRVGLERRFPDGGFSALGSGSGAERLTGPDVAGE